jgi:hypothetical protein
MDPRFNPNQQPYQPYNPDPYQQGQNPYQQGQSTPPPPPYGPTNPDPYNPYIAPPTVPDPYTPYAPPQQQPPQPPVQPTYSRPPGRSRGRMLLILSVVLIIIVIAALAIFIPYQNTQNEHATATSTAQTKATNVARAATGTANASNATATAVAQAQAAQTATAVVLNQNPYPPHTGTLTLSDPLADNSKGNNWPDSVDQSGSGCTFKDGAYHLIQPVKGYIQSCTTGTFSNLAAQVEMTILKGDCGALIFRQGDSYYTFSVCQNGSYFLDIYGKVSKNLVTSSSTAIKTGLNQMNVIAVVANGSSITLYVNGHDLSSLNDGTLNSGGIGFGANAFTGATEVAYTNVKVWTL